MDDKTLEYFTLSDSMRMYIRDIEAQRDELLEALEEMVNVAERIDTAEFFPSAPLERALDAIAKAKGE